MSLVNQVNYKEKKYKNARILNVHVFDLENVVLNRYTDDRVSEVYLVCDRRVKTEKLYADIDSGRKVDYNSPKVIQEYLDEPIFFRTIKEYIDFLKKESEESLVLAYAHNLEYELSYILRETNASTIGYGKGKQSIIARTNNSPIAIVLDELPKVEFRCSYALTGYSIKTLGKNFKFEKLNYNYETIRRSTDELIENDFIYNDTDVVISGMAIIQKALMRKQYIDNLPLTTTSEMNADKEAFIKSTRY